jgi:hypothetical protein
MGQLARCKLTWPLKIVYNTHSSITGTLQRLKQSEESWLPAIRYCLDQALYRGYTDATFTQQTEQPTYQGTQGMQLHDLTISTSV